MDPIKYPKINTIWQREPPLLEDFTKNPRVGCIMPGQYSDEVVEQLSAQNVLWNVTEKLHGINCRIFFDTRLAEISFAGRTPKHAFAKHAKKFLAEKITHEGLYEAFPPEERELTIPGTPRHTWSYSSGVLFGELVGEQAQKGGSRYCEDGQDYDIILFDAYANGTWLEWENVCDISHKLGLKHVPYVGQYTTRQTLSLFDDAGHPFNSILAIDGEPAEGVVCSVRPMMLERVRGVPIRWKIKREDYDRLRRLINEQ